MPNPRACKKYLGACSVFFRTVCELKDHLVGWNMNKNKWQNWKSQQGKLNCATWSYNSKHIGTCINWSIKCNSSAKRS